MRIECQVENADLQIFIEIAPFFSPEMAPFSDPNFQSGDRTFHLT
jgi:hypothetical protein